MKKTFKSKIIIAGAVLVVLLAVGAFAVYNYAGVSADINEDMLASDLSYCALSPGYIFENSFDQTHTENFQDSYQAGLSYKAFTYHFRGAYKTLDNTPNSKWKNFNNRTIEYNFAAHVLQDQKLWFVVQIGLADFENVLNQNEKFPESYSVKVKFIDGRTPAELSLGQLGYDKDTLSFSFLRGSYSYKTIKEVSLIRKVSSQQETLATVSLVSPIKNDNLNIISESDLSTFRPHFSLHKDAQFRDFEQSLETTTDDPSRNFKSPVFRRLSFDLPNEMLDVVDDVFKNVTFRFIFGSKYYRQVNRGQWTWHNVTSESVLFFDTSDRRDVSENNILTANIFLKDNTQIHKEIVLNPNTRRNDGIYPIIDGKLAVVINRRASEVRRIDIFRAPKSNPSAKVMLMRFDKEPFEGEFIIPLASSSPPPPSLTPTRTSSIGVTASKTIAPITQTPRASVTITPRRTVKVKPTTTATSSVSRTCQLIRQNTKLYQLLSGYYNKKCR